MSDLPNIKRAEVSEEAYHYINIFFHNVPYTPEVIEAHHLKASYSLHFVRMLKDIITIRSPLRLSSFKLCADFT